ncbi:MAG: hypothetical protein V1834_00825 [Candidatus Micrarchaeota archaeon]
MKKYVPLLLFAAIAFSVYAHWMVFNEFYRPTYGNTNIHTASEKHLIEHGYYPIQNDYSYGGGEPNLYVPLYRFNAANFMVLTGFDFDFGNRLIVILFALLLPLGFFLLGRELAGDWAGVMAAFLASLPAELLIYTVRPLPQALGLALLPIALYLMLKKEWLAALIASAGVVLVHQEAGVFLVGVAFATGVGKIIIDYWNENKLVASDLAKIALACWLVGTAAYFGWHFFVTGNVNVFELAQFQHHEGGVITQESFFTKTGYLIPALSVFGIIGLLWALLSKKLDDAGLLVLSALAVGVFATQNHLVGINVFMDRFLVFVQIPLIAAAAYGFLKVFEIASWIAEKVNNYS